MSDRLLVDDFRETYKEPTIMAASSHAARYTKYRAFSGDDRLNLLVEQSYIIENLRRILKDQHEELFGLTAPF